MSEKKEKKARMPVWLYPSTTQAVEEWVIKDNCKSRSEFIEKAILYYAGGLSCHKNQYLPIAITSALEGLVEGSENRIARLLFKMSVEMSMLMNLYAADNTVDPEVLIRLRGKCVNDVKKTNGTVVLDEIVRYQNER